MKIGELARATGTQVETIRFYEREGLLPEPSRTEGNYRIYEDDHAERLSLIRQCRSLDIWRGPHGYRVAVLLITAMQSMSTACTSNYANRRSHDGNKTQNIG